MLKKIFVQNFSLLLIGVIFFVNNGCTERGHPIRYRDAGFVEDAWYQQFVPYDTGPPCVESDIVRLSSDYANCGQCGNICVGGYADNCFTGVCSCGRVPACLEGSGCVRGNCLETDTTGDNCEFDGNCRPGFACVENHCTFFECTPEVCDGYDNDCDAEIDENGDSTGPLSRWCYNGMGASSTTTIIPPCRRGLQVCEYDGLWSTCEGNIEPRSESGLLACNSVDDNCDGCIDGVLTETGACQQSVISGYDIVYAIDISSSMSGTINAVKMATLDFSTRFAADPSFRFAIVLTPGSEFSMTPIFTFPDGTSQVALDLSSYSTFISTLMTISANGGSSEATWDAIYELGTGEEVLSWREDSIRLIILFTDELAQTYRNRITSGTLMDVNEADVCSSLTHGESLTVFTHSRFFSMWDDCATVLELSSDAAAMYDNLNLTITDPCTI
jgi:hypothetical protein